MIKENTKLEMQTETDGFHNTIISALPIVSAHLEDKYGFECNIDYDRAFPTDEYYSLKIVTYKKKIVGNLKIHITETFKFIEAPDTYKYQGTTVEIVQGTEFQEIKIDKMWQLLMLIDMLQGVQRHNVLRLCEVGDLTHKSRLEALMFNLSTKV